MKVIKQNRNIVSFSLWGKKEKYNRGAIENVKLVNKYYMGYIPLFFCAQDVPQSTIEELKKYNAKIQIMDTKDSNWNGLFWRFLALRSTGVVLIRDVDSRITTRETCAVKSWLASKYDFHVMRDHRSHNVPIMGGLFGCRGFLIVDIERLMEKYKKKNPDLNKKGSDQKFLRKIIWPIVRDRTLAHDRYFKGHQWPDYEYKPKEFFGKHKIMKFPNHPPIKTGHGSFVGDIIE